MSLVTSENCEIKRICFLGAGYVGGPTGAVIAAKCPDIEVKIVDLSAERVEAWKSGNLPVKEPFLEEIVAQSLGNNLQFTTDAKTAIEEAQIIFISVNTPTKTFGIGAGAASDLTAVLGAAQMISDYAQSDKIVVVKSTVPVGTCDMLERTLNAVRSRLKFTVLSNPEFLAEGTAISNLLNPDRVLIGSKAGPVGTQAGLLLASVYGRWVSPQAICRTTTASAELAKLAANAMLAQRISSINALSAVCESAGADVTEVAHAIGMDPRIGSQFLKAGVGFGGSCFQKDILNLSYLSSQLGLKEVTAYWKGVIDMNDWQKSRFVRLIISSLHGCIYNTKIAVLGYAFKKDTGDTRETPAKDIVKGLLADGASVHLFDPLVAHNDILMDFPEAKGLKIASSIKSACHEAKAVVICTDWSHFLQVDWKAIYADMKKPAFIFDGRSLLKPEEMKEIGFKYFGIGIGN